MQIRSRIGSVALGPTARRDLERKVRLMLGRHAATIERVDLALAGDPEAQSVRCRIRITTRHDDGFASEGHGDDPPTAVRAATQRALHRLDARRGGSLPGGRLRRTPPRPSRPYQEEHRT